MAASRIIFDHFALSARNNAAESSGVVLTTVNPSAAILSLISGTTMARLISRLSSTMTSLDVPAGTTNANQPSPWTSGYPASAVSGTWGNAGDRVLLVTASARSFPSRICGTAGGNDVNAIGV